ncbi:hypothetical protein [Nocardiopsis ansamitocini]|uniref:Uncharacterized protein n=1 Tax=Nocardiopsis ansamitocini TaxID=1670832 RepID=A0A9W6P3V6_9ACTN|nr:hypothetical protein [Nocardiopsis ansamitocini]GLU46814.1 hypothetical protein Nans01_11650 [Nocardiopsis ansamitocini]
MPKPLSDGAQRLVFGLLVVVLVAFGIYWSVGGFSDGGENAPSQEQAEAPDSSQQPVAPIPTTAAEEVELFDLFPFTEEELTAAAVSAQSFAEAYGTIDYSESPETYYGRMEQLATEEYAETLAQSSGAGAMWGERAESEAVSQGLADLRSIRGFDNKSIVFVLKVQSITEDNDGATQNLGDFAVTVVREGGAWQVFDFQPADLGNLGEG